MVVVVVVDPTMMSTSVITITSEKTRPLTFSSMTVSLPQEITDKIIDTVAKDQALQVPTLRTCSLVSRTWVYRSQKHLFSNIELHGSSIDN